MQWQDARRSTNIEDRRGIGPGGLIGGGIGAILLVILALFFGVDPRMFLQPDSTVNVAPTTVSPADEKTKDFVSTVLGYTEDTWTGIFHNEGRTYEEPKLVLFNGAVESACGLARSATGPFYCPADHQAYLDMSFFQDLRNQFGAPGDFAQAYVIAHEIGHHVQNQLGILPRVDAYRQRANEVDANQASVRLELQADCFAGVWANQTERQARSEARGFLEKGDVEEALRAASMIGDDRLQMRSQGYVVPESFTHGTAAQRLYWFKAGLASGNMSACDTFSTAE
jgi:predicted metalloprotease